MRVGAACNSRAFACLFTVTEWAYAAERGIRQLPGTSRPTFIAGAYQRLSLSRDDDESIAGLGPGPPHALVALTSSGA